MAYCVKCGVKLEDSEKKCPLCQTVVYHPDLPPAVNAKTPFPKEHLAEVKKMSMRFGLMTATLIILLLCVLTLICDYSINSKIVWSDIAVSSVGLAYCVIFIPLIFPRKKALTYLTVDFLALLLFQWYIEHTTDGAWFFGFALPATCSAMLIIYTAMLIKKFTKASGFLIAAVIFILSGLNCILIEFLINKTFMDKVKFVWSYYPLITFIVIGVIMFLCDRNKRLKEKLKKKFFI
ncbi:MAG: hypothetical protein J6B75_07765 [Ruminococcus sp.]|nr:hypothetical protein [Ruminococcus sp.]